MTANLGYVTTSGALNMSNVPDPPQLFTLFVRRARRR